MKQLQIVAKRQIRTNSTITSSMNDEIVRSKDSSQSNCSLLRSLSTNRRKYHFSLDLEPFKLNLAKFCRCDIDESEFPALLEEFFDIISKFLNDAEFDRTEDEEFYMRDDYVLKQAELYSEQYFDNCKAIQEDLYIKIDSITLTERVEIYSMELNVEIRRVIQYLALFCGQSKEFSELVLTWKVKGKEVIADIICAVYDKIIKDERYVPRNKGIVLVLCHLLKNLTSYYGAYKDIRWINVILDKLFGLTLRVATYDIEMMHCLSEAFKNIAKPNHLDLLLSMCIRNAPHIYFPVTRMYRLDLKGCKLQIYFSLMNHVFRYRGPYQLRGYFYETLIMMVKNWNLLAHTMLSNDIFLQFLVPSMDSETTCTCYNYFVSGSLILFCLLLRNRNDNIQRMMLNFI